MRILVVEDDADIAANVADYLRALGHDTGIAGDGRSALKKASDESYDLLILDRMLPKLDGIELCRRLRRDNPRPTPVIMLTALGSTEDKVAGFEAGADDYLVKPFSLVELKLRIEAVSRRYAPAGGAQTLSVGDLSYNPQTLQATRAGRALALNPSTRKLLELLMRETHRVVPRAELEQLLWGKQAPEEDVLRMHVSNLRTAVDKPFKVKLLQTVHGVGYRLSDEAAT